MKNYCNLKNTVILKIQCPDRKGIVAAVSDFVSSHNGNILTLDQFSDPTTQLFFMRIEWDLAGFSLTEKQLPKALESLPGSKELFFSKKYLRLAIFVSKYDHCLYDLLLRHKSGELCCEIPLIISNHADLKDIADMFHIDFHYIATTNKAAAEKKQLQLLAAYQIDFIALARYMQVLSEKMIAHFPQRIINVHHSFLPAFKGAKPYQQAYEKGVKIIGATSHFVNAELDQGPIIQQEVAVISHRDTVDDLTVKGRDLERKVLAEAIRLYTQHRLFVCGNRTIIL